MTGIGGSGRGFPPRLIQHPRTPGTARHGHIPTASINKRQWTGQQFPTHRFDSANGGTRITDEVLYMLSYGPLGRLAHALWFDDI